MAQNQSSGTVQHEATTEQASSREKDEKTKEVKKTSADQKKGVEENSVSLEALLDSLRKVREDVGQISELSSEEGKIVAALILTFLKFMKPLMRDIQVDPESLPQDMGMIQRANLVPGGLLIAQFDDGGMFTKDLSREENRDLLVKVVNNVIPKFNKTVEERRRSIEKRIDFLTSVTKELQNISDALTPEPE